MEHNPFVSFPNGLEITHSGLKERKNGTEYVTIYFEQPNKKKTDFCSARINFPGGRLRSIKGYTAEQVIDIMGYVARLGHTALQFAREESHIR